MPAIHLSPSDDYNILHKTIIDAANTNKKLVLDSGIHYTMLGRGEDKQIPIGSNGLQIKGKAAAWIKRPIESIDLEHSDGNYGLFFIPAPPNEGDWKIENGWQHHTSYKDDGSVRESFDYIVLKRGKIIIENLDIDCNMGNQLLPVDIAADKIEHSAMLGFSGHRYFNNDKSKAILIAFECVTIKNIKTHNGGFADDIWISRGYFRPNIERVVLKNIVSCNRVHPKRGTICFSGLCKKIEISNVNVYRIEAEATAGRWTDLPDSFESPSDKSEWILKNINCEYLDLAAKGKSILLNGTNVNTTKQVYLYQIGGILRKSNLIVHNGENRRLIRMDNMYFKNVTWNIPVNENGEIIGILPTSQKNENCVIKFENNKFLLIDSDYAPISGSLVKTQYSNGANVQQNSIELEFKSCNFNINGTDNSPNNSLLMILNERGKYKFKKSEFQNLFPNISFKKGHSIQETVDHIIVTIE